MRPLTALVATALVVVAAAGCTSSKTGNDAASSRPPNSTASSPSPTPTASTSLSDSQRVALWYAGVQPHFTAIQSDTEAIKAAAQANKATALPALCGELRTNVAAANSDPAPPNKLLASAVASALTAYAGAAQSCLAGDYNAAATGINQGAAFLSKANDIMSNLS